MRITFKLYASLGAYLPAQAREHAVTLDVAPGTSADALVDRHGIPRALAHLVLRNGVYLAPEQRSLALAEGDTLAIWPPVAGG
ncbi:MAG: MoaD/ThiS family protein [Gammaproteobacteria bacterium]|nr:MoaD/ThiS family protein [Gammaproteobacteria bacterium]